MYLNSFLYSAVVIAVLSNPCANATENLQLQAGEYIMERGNGLLLLNATKDQGHFLFSIETRWANGHVCGLEGEIQDAQAHVSDNDGQSLCLLSFHPSTKGIVVNQESEGCRDFCGARATMSGEYFVPEKGCSTANVISSRNEFKELFDSKKFKKAKEILKPLLTTCSETLYNLDSAWIRNDLALTYYKLKDYSECMSTLEPLADVAATYDGAKTEDLMPELLEFVPVMNATLTNLKLCKKKLH